MTTASRRALSQGSRPAVPALAPSAQANKKPGALADLHSQRVTSLLRTRGRLQSENAELRRRQQQHRQSSTGRGPAFARAERELVLQDIQLRTLYEHLGAEVAREEILKVLEAGPRRKRATTREELRWRVEEIQLATRAAQEELARLRDERCSKDDTEDTAAVAAAVAAVRELRLAEVRHELEEVKQHVANEEQANAARRVENECLDRILKRGLLRIEEGTGLLKQRPLALAGAVGGLATTEDLRSRLKHADAELVEMHSLRHALEEDLLQSSRVLAESQRAVGGALRELASTRERSSEAHERLGIVLQGDLLNERRKLQQRRGRADSLQSHVKATRATHKGDQLDGLQRNDRLRTQLDQQLKVMEQVARQRAEVEEAAAISGHDEELSALDCRLRRSESECRFIAENAAQWRSETDEERQKASSARTKITRLEKAREDAAQRNKESQSRAEAAEHGRHCALDGRRSLVTAYDNLMRQVDESRWALQRQRDHLLQRGAGAQTSAQLAAAKPARNQGIETAAVQVAHLKAEVLMAEELAARDLASIRGEAETERAVLLAHSEAASERQKVARERRAAFDEIRRFRQRQALLQQTTCEREVAAHNLAVLRAQMSLLAADQEARRQHEAADRDRNTAAAAGAALALQQEVLARAHCDRKAAAQALADAHEQCEQLLAEIHGASVQHAAEPILVEGGDSWPAFPPVTSPRTTASFVETEVTDVLLPIEVHVGDVQQPRLGGDEDRELLSTLRREVAALEVELAAMGTGSVGTEAPWPMKLAVKSPSDRIGKLKDECSQLETCRDALEQELASQLQNKP